MRLISIGNKGNEMTTKEKFCVCAPKLFRACVRRFASVAAVLSAVMIANATYGVQIDEEWFPEWIGDEDYEDGYYYYSTTVICSERDEDNWNKLNNGCFVKIGKTNAKGITKFTASYIDGNGRKQTVSHSWRDDGGDVDFTADGHRYWFNWDVTPYGCWLEVDPVYDSNGNWLYEESEHFYAIDPKGSGGAAIPDAWKKARTLTGLFGEGCEDGVEGTAQLKCGKANKKGIAKVSLTITPFAGKKRTYRSVAVDVTQGGNVEVRWPQQKYAVTIEGDEFFGEPIYDDDMRPACSPNAVWNANVGGSFNKTAKFDFGEIPDRWEVLQDLWTVDGDGYAEVFSPVEVSMNGTRWTLPKAARMGKIKLCAHSTGSSHCMYEWALKTDGDVANIPALKLSYNAKTGLFKGRFNIYVDGGKKYAAKVTGVMVDGVGLGQAACSKLMFEPWAITVE